MNVLTFHEGLKKSIKCFVISLISFVAGFFVCNTYLRWEGIETEMMTPKEVRYGVDAHYFSICHSTTERDVKILQETGCGVDSCHYQFFDFDGASIGRADWGMVAEAIDPSVYAKQCRVTTPEYFYRFVKKD